MITVLAILLLILFLLVLVVFFTPVGFIMITALIGIVAYKICLKIKDKHDKKH